MFLISSLLIWVTANSLLLKENMFLLSCLEVWIQSVLLSFFIHSCLLISDFLPLSIKHPLDPCMGQKFKFQIITNCSRSQQSTKFIKVFGCLKYGKKILWEFNFCAALGQNSLNWLEIHRFNMSLFLKLCDSYGSKFRIWIFPSGFF